MKDSHSGRTSFLAASVATLAVMLAPLALAKNAYLTTPTPVLKTKLPQTALKKKCSTSSELSTLQDVARTAANAPEFAPRTSRFTFSTVNL
jgi:hypothetical protein